MRLVAPSTQTRSKRVHIGRLSINTTNPTKPTSPLRTAVAGTAANDSLRASPHARNRPLAPIHPRLLTDSPLRVRRPRQKILQRQWRRPSTGAISRRIAHHTRSSPAHIFGSPSLNTRHCLTSLGLGSKCSDQLMPPEKLQSTGWRLCHGISCGVRQLSIRAARSDLVAELYDRMLKCCE
jgi:hypothetical protein